jgi:membrane protease YdiL (CAAX protease family)
MPKTDLTSEPEAETKPPVASPITWSPWIAAILVIASFLVATVLGQVLVSIYPALTHMSAARTQDWLDSSTAAQFAYTLLAYGLLLLPLAWFVRHYKVSFGTFGIKKPRLRDPLYGLLALAPYYASYLVIVAVVSALVPELNTSQQQQIGFGGAHGAGPLILTFLSLAIIPPLVEETVIRGFLYTSFRAKLKLPVAVILTSIIFAAGHLQFGSGAPLLWIAAIDTFTLSLFLIYLREKTGSLWASITLHALKNSIAFLYLFILHRG